MDRAKKLPYIRMLPIIILSILSYFSIKNFNMVMDAFNTILGIITPFFWAFGIAFVLGPIIDIFEKRLKVIRPLAILLAYILMFSILILIITLLFPIIAMNINDIIQRVPQFITQLQNFVVANAEKYQALTNIDYNSIFNFKNINVTNIQSLFNEVGKYFNVFTGLIGGFMTLTTGLIKMSLGVVISIYFLLDKKNFKESVKKTIYAFTKPETAKSIIDTFREAKVIFSKYLIGQATDSSLIGFIAFIGFSIIGTPYAVLMGIILGFTNMIPFFGPIIGLVPIVGITLFYSPITALYTMAFILILQQVDGNIIAPRIVGGSVGVTPFWSISAILVGGALFGVVGMLICVPTFAFLRNIFVRQVDRVLEKKQKNKQLVEEIGSL